MTYREVEDLINRLKVQKQQAQKCRHTNASSKMRNEIESY